jgi:signal peptidase I
VKPTIAQPCTRSPIWAVLLAVFVAPTVSFLYLGRGRRALVYLAATLLLAIAAIATAVLLHWPVGLMLALVQFTLAGVGGYDAYRTAKPLRLRFFGPWYSRWHGTLAAGLLIAAPVILIRAFLVEPFHIPANSMVPTLESGDFILVNKFIYGLRLPILNTRFLPVSRPQRGDVAVFNFPPEPRISYIKRVIGLPGDTVEYRDKRLTVNGKAVMTSPSGYLERIGEGGAHLAGELWKETLDEHHYTVMKEPGMPPIMMEMVNSALSGHCSFAADYFICKIPPDNYFVMGDHRDASNDSRYWGFVPESHLIGKAIYLWRNDRNPERAGHWLY